jgi:hypothetical protein
MFGTEDIDFISGMYGDLTFLFDKRTQTFSGPVQGKNRSVSELQNTSFTALGRLRPSFVREKMTITLFENASAKVKVPYENLPSCFEVMRVDVQYSDEPWWPEP